MTQSSDPKNISDTAEQSVHDPDSQNGEAWSEWESSSSSSTWAQQDDHAIEEIHRLKEALARSQADYQNLVMRSERDRSDMGAYLSLKILVPLLKEIDNLERAVKLKTWIEWDGFVDGIRSVLLWFSRYLESQGVIPFDSLGHEVDPEKHDVMAQAPGEEWKIVSEFERGYMMGDRVLRHAKVVVGLGGEE